MDFKDCKTVRLGLGNAINFRRTCLGLSVQFVASAIGISANNYRRIEAGKYSPTFDILSRISQVLGSSFTLVPNGSVEFPPDIEIKNYDILPGDKFSFSFDSDSFYKVTIVKEKIHFGKLT